MNEHMAKCLVRTAPGIIFAAGLVAPLLTQQSLLRHAALGAIACAALFTALVLIGMAGSRIPQNARSSFAVLLTGGLVAIGAIAAAPFFKTPRLPVETVAPLLFVALQIALHTEAYAVKKMIQPVLLDTLGIGIGFTALLVVCGLVRDLPVETFAAAMAVVIPCKPAAFLQSPAGILLIVALVPLCGRMIHSLTRRKKS